MVQQPAWDKCASASAKNASRHDPPACLETVIQRAVPNEVVLRFVFVQIFPVVQHGDYQIVSPVISSISRICDIQNVA